MKFGKVMAVFRCLGLVLLFFARADASDAGISGVERVLGMLEKMKKQAKTERNDEELGWAKQKAWCEGRVDELDTEVEENAESIKSLEAETDRIEDDISNLNAALTKLSGEIERSKADLDKANKERAEDKAAFEKQDTDYSESADALNRAITVLREHQKAGKSLAQIDADQLGLPQQTSEAVTAFLSSRGESEEDPPSTGILQLLDKLYDNFKKELLDIKREEQKAKTDHEIIKAQTEATIATAEEDKKGKTEERDRHSVKVADNKKRLNQVKTLIEEAEKAIQETKRDCSIKEEEFHQTYKVLREEMDALQKASDIISSQLQTSAGLLQRQGTALAELRGHSVQRQQVRKFLADEGQKLGSKTLALLVQQLDADPFAKVRKVINDILMKLQEEAMEESKLHAYCSAETENNKLSRTSLSEKVEALEAEIEETKAAIKELAASTEAMASEISKSQQEFSEAQEIRTKEEAKNYATIKEAKAAQRATAEAIQVLKDFYSNGAFVQLGASSEFQVESESSSESSSGRDGNAVIGMLEVIQADFSELEEDTKVDETSQKRAFAELEAQTQEEKAVKGTQIKLNTKSKNEKEVSLKEAMDDLDRNEIELESVNRYSEKLKEKCGLNQESFDERVAKAKEEIKTLKMALKMLSIDK
eukprot:CAMPEP_0197654898 /NCGR_PEP_ID=MMETSP1338-20131121/39126_1 /TAXON_ID=43686 ORGANISM="Pelagodinium beii, Strain RCC1491" /NCGR_SAMPLE_ID=MMETSP1338 /ASSEMBLY_ACC=CAM_ASM_000754 /LENGTH=650 /DNA_ID=CAMNT_0043230435 /DNA_START=75 /DNA_END=2027 /DNA_ORIENTATION=+